MSAARIGCALIAGVLLGCGGEVPGPRDDAAAHEPSRAAQAVDLTGRDAAHDDGSSPVARPPASPEDVLEDGDVQAAADPALGAPPFAAVEAPAVRVDEPGAVQRISWPGMPFAGEPTRVHALFATPGSLAGDPALDVELPAVVLLHGGGGRAFGAWVRAWAQAGYAALAPDASGAGEQAGPADSALDRFGRLDQSPSEHWNAHALQAARAALAWLRARADVDPSATAVVGTSWGGVHALRIAGLDEQLAAAVSVYGTGLLDRSGFATRKLAALPPAHAERWMTLYDPAAGLADSRAHVLLAGSTDDRSFPLDVLLGTGVAASARTTLSVALHLEHDHATAWGLPVVRRFVDARLGRAALLPRPGVPRVEVSSHFELAELIVEVSGGAFVEAEVLEGRGEPGALTWTARPASVAPGEVRSAAPGADVRVWMVSVVDADGVRVTSPPVGDVAAAAAAR